MVVLVSLMELAIVRKDFLGKNVITLFKVIEILNHKSNHVEKNITTCWTNIEK
jgi:hypothetical protein